MWVPNWNSDIGYGTRFGRGQGNSKLATPTSYRYIQPVLCYCTKYNFREHNCTSRSLLLVGVLGTVVQCSEYFFIDINVVVSSNLSFESHQNIFWFTHLACGFFEKNRLLANVHCTSTTPQIRRTMYYSKMYGETIGEHSMDNRQYWSTSTLYCKNCLCTSVLFQLFPFTFGIVTKQQILP